MNKKLTILAIVTTVAAFIFLRGGVAQAGDSTVPAGFATIQAAIDDAGTVAGDTITLTAAGHSEANIHVTKAITIAGGVGASLDPGAGGIGIYPDVDGVTIRDLTIENGSQAIRFEKAGGTIDNTEINNVRLLNNSSRGIEVHNATTVTNLRVIDCFFDNPNVGIRFASSAIGNGILVDGSTFQNHSLGLYEANDGSTGFVQNLTVTNSTFLNNTFAGIYGEELRDVEVAYNTFTDNQTGFQLFSIYTTATVLTGDISIHHNTFTDSSRAAVLIDTDAFELPVTIEDNTISADVSVLLAGFQVDKGQQIALRLASGFPHGAVTVRRNTVSFAGSFGLATAAYAIEVRGDFDAGLTITQNTLQGGVVGNNGGVPPTSGIFLITDDPTFWGAPTSGSVATVFCNTITGFVNGVSAFDEVNTTFGGLPTGVQLYVNSNNIAGNSTFGINNGGISETIDATNNWWGASDGPSGSGPGSGDAVSANVDFDPFLTKAPNSTCPGFVSGGGIVESPAGADANNLIAAGPATFGFVSKYLKGKTTPDGNLVFFFKAGDLHFKSTSMDSLVVTGQPRAMFRGEGTINEGPVCKFEVDAWDGSFDSGVDAFGIKIHGCDTGTEDRYLLGATPLTKGSITVHKK